MTKDYFKTEEDQKSSWINLNILFANLFDKI
jgi:hypothetical protein